MLLAGHCRSAYMTDKLASLSFINSLSIGPHATWRGMTIIIVIDTKMSSADHGTKGDNGECRVAHCWQGGP